LQLSGAPILQRNNGVKNVGRFYNKATHTFVPQYYDAKRQQQRVTTLRTPHSYHFRYLAKETPASARFAPHTPPACSNIIN